MKEKKQRNEQIVTLFKEFISIKQISELHNLTQSTAREILIRCLGLKEYLRIRKEKIKATSRRYGENYLKQRIIINR